ncbi:MAG: DsbA family protein [Bacteroidota bacterium]
MNNCDPNGFCEPAPLEDNNTHNTPKSDMTVIYVGDPMCSWCWGISEHLKRFRKTLAEKGIRYEIVVGGLRPGGGDPWNDKFKDFLRHHWEAVTERSGQPFGYTLLERATFIYDTEPSCRAVVSAKQFVGGETISLFFEEVQRKFYVDSEDPTTPEFYRSICEKFGIDFDAFTLVFKSEEAKTATRNEFVLNREWGIRGYPTVLLQHKERLIPLANGYVDLEGLTGKLAAYELASA